MSLTRIEIRRGTTSQWTSADPVLLSGEPGFDTTLGAFKIGDGATAWTSLPWAPASLFGAAPAPAWRDMIGVPVNRTGVTNPTWTQIATSPFFGYFFQLNDELQFDYHIQHDYKAGTGIYLHAHWLTDGTQTNTCKWEFTYTYARGHNQANFNLTGTTVTVTEAAAGTPYRHMTSEIATAITDATFEPDGIITVRLRRVTNGGTNLTDKVFLRVADCHYQVDRFGTLNKAPNFYT